MSDEDRRMFEREPAAQAAIRVRQWDDGAKVAGLDVPPLVTYLPLLQRVMAAGR